jgi:hypothetical protein
MQSFYRLFIFLFLLVSISSGFAQSKYDAFCKFTLGDNISLYQKDLQSTGNTDGVYTYRYKGILCQSYFSMEIAYNELQFKDDKLIHIKASTYLNSGQVEIFADKALEEYGKPTAIQKEENKVISKRIWNGKDTWVSLTVTSYGGDDYNAAIEVSYN